MAKAKVGYLQALRDYTAAGGKDINEFLKLLTASDKEMDSPPGADNTYYNGPLANPPSASPTPGTRVSTNDFSSQVSAQIAAAQQRFATPEAAGTPPATGNVITGRPSQVVVQPVRASAPGKYGSPGAPVRPQVPVVEFQNPINAANSEEDAQKEVPWWRQAAGSDAFKNDPEFEKYIAQNKQSEAGARTLPPDLRTGHTNFIRLNRNTYIPSSVNYNRTSSI